MRDLPDDKKKEIISRWLMGEYRDKIASELSISSAQLNSVINEWKREIGSAIAESYRGVLNSGLTSLDKLDPSDIIQAFKLVISLNKIGVTSQNFDEFMSRFSKIVLATTGMGPEGFASMIIQILKLADLDGIEIHQLPAHLEGLQVAKKELEAEIQELERKKESESILGLPISPPTEPVPDLPVEKELIPQLVAMAEQMKNFSISMDDISAFTDMINNAKKYGYNFETIVDFVSSVGALEKELNEKKLALERLGKIKETMLATQRSLEEELSGKQDLLNSISKLAQTGLDLSDFELIKDLIYKTAEVNKIEDINAAKQRFFEDVQKLYSNEAKTPLIEQRLDSAEPQQDKHNKELFNMVERLTAKGITEQTLMKSLIINEIFQLDLDALADDLKKYSNLRKAGKYWEERRKKLESDELVLKHKVLALEERHHQIASALSKETFEKPQMTIDVDQAGKKFDLTPLIKIAKGEKRDSLSSDELNKAIIDAIDLVSQGLDPESLTKKILDHARFSLEHEPSAPHNSI